MQKQWQQFNNSIDFFELFDASSFDEEVMLRRQWLGYARNEAGELELQACFVYDKKDGEVQDSGWGWYI